MLRSVTVDLEKTQIRLIDVCEVHSIKSFKDIKEFCLKQIVESKRDCYCSVVNNSCTLVCYCGDISLPLNMTRYNVNRDLLLYMPVIWMLGLCHSKHPWFPYL